jgi:hypothetical protein
MVASITVVSTGNYGLLEGGRAHGWRNGLGGEMFVGHCK